MKIKDIVKIAVIQTNPYWPFYSLNKLPYHLAIKAFIQHCKKFSEIKSVYLKHSFVEGNWVPGLSDIDWTIVINDNLGAGQELAFLNQFWNKYDKIKRIFSMLGEGEILSRKDLENMVLVGIRSYEFRYWKLVHGIDFLRKRYIQNNVQKDMLFYAFAYYYEYLTEKFFSHGTPTGLLVKELNRVLKKIIKSVDCCNEIEKQREPAITLIDSFRLAIRKLDGISVGESGSNLQKFDEFKISVRKSEWEGEARGAYLRKYSIFIDELLEESKQIIDAIFFMDEDFGPYVVLKDDLDDNKIGKILMDTRKSISNFHIRFPYIGTKKIFKNSVEFYNPFWYYLLAIRDRILYGRNIVSEIKPPHKFALSHYVIRKSVSIPAEIRRHPRTDISYTQWLLEPAMNYPAINYSIKETIAMKLILEKGIIITSEKALFDEWERHFPDSYIAFKGINEKRNKDEMFLAHRKFSLIRSIIKDLDQKANYYFHSLMT